MRYYFAPLEGLTDSTFRRLHHKYFPGVDQYYTPFFSPTPHRSLTPKERRELPEAQEDFIVVPQVLTKNSADFLWMADQCRDQGYQQINLNIGCPSGTVTAKGKGAGMLQDLDALDRFLDEIFSSCSLPISVKTRIGFSSPEEFPQILQVLNRYPIYELTIHPRVRKDFYSSQVDMDAFRYALANSAAPLCYNGNLCSHSQIRRFQEEFPSVKAVMLGRGLIADPGLFSQEGTQVQTLARFHDELLENYLEAFGGSRNAMFRMKEHWRYLIRKFENADKLGKRLRKTTDLAEYKSITKEIFGTLSMLDEVNPDW